MRFAGFAGNGEVYSWGRGTFGRLGTGREADEHVPTAVVPAVAVGGGRQRPRFAAVATGAYHSLALDGWCSVPLPRCLLVLLLLFFVIVRANCTLK